MPSTSRSPRFTRVSEGKALRRFEVTSKAGLLVVDPELGHDCLLLAGGPALEVQLPPVNRGPIEPIVHWGLDPQLDEIDGFELA